MTSQTEALKLALEALEDAQYFIEAELNDRMDLYKNYTNLAHKYAGEQESLRKNKEAITAIKEALAQPEHELKNLERHERNVQQLFGTPQPKEPIKDSEALHLADAIELRVENRAERMVIADKLRKLAYTTPPQRKPLTDDEAFKLIEQDYQMEEYAQAALQLIRRTEAAHGIKE